MVYLASGTFISAIMIGTFLNSLLGEKQGRLYMLRWSVAISTLTEFLILASGDIWYFTVCIGLLGLFLQGSLIFPFIYITEVASYSARTNCLLALSVCYVVAYLPSYFLVYHFFTWRPIVIASLACGLFCFLFSWTLVESPRYFAVNLSLFNKARTALEYIAQSNKKPMFEGLLQGEILNQYSETIRRHASVDVIDKKEYSGFALENSDIIDNSEIIENNAIRENLEISEEVIRDVAPFEYLGGAVNAVERELFLDRGQSLGFLDLFKENLRYKSIVLAVLWCIHGGNLYIYSHSSIFDGDMYLDITFFVIFCSAGFAICAAVGICIKGKKLISLFCVFSGLFSGIQGALLLNQTSSSASFAIGLAAISGFQGVLLIYSLEIFPTGARSNGFGLMLLGSLVGLIISSQLLSFSSILLCIFSLLSIVFPVLLYKLEDTSKVPLSDYSEFT